MRRHAKAIVAISALLLTLVLGVSLANAVAPTVTIEEASDVAYTTAQVKGTVDPQGQATTWRIQYIDDAAYNATADAVQMLWMSATAGTYTLTFQGQTTAPIAYDASAADVESALNALGSIGGAGGSVVVTGGPGDENATSPYTITFGGSLAHTPLETLSLDTSGLTPGPSYLQTETTVNGRAPGFEGATTAFEESTEVPEAIERELTGLSHNTTYHLRLVAENADGSSAAVASSTFTTKKVTPPVVTAPVATEIKGESAKVEGTVEVTDADPAFNASCHFEYVNHNGFEEAGGTFDTAQSVPCDEATVTGSSSQPVTVKSHLSSLEPNTAYHFRLVASNAGGSDAVPATSPFATVVIKPTIRYSPAVEPTGEKIGLAAYVNPHNAPLTDCRFVYGKSVTYGSQASCASSPVGNRDTLVTAYVDGLTPGTTYHFKLITANQAGIEEGADQTFSIRQPAISGPCTNERIREQQQATYLPSCRAYEMVSPADKAGATVSAKPFNGPGQLILSAVAKRGDAAMFWSYGAFADAESAHQNAYLATRTNTGWSTTAIVPKFPGVGHRDLENGKARAVGATPELSRFFLYSGLNFDPLDDDKYSADVYATSPGEKSATWISRPDGVSADTAQSRAAWVGSSEDGSKVFFQSNGQLTTSALGQVPGADVLYEREGTHTRMVSVDDDGTAVSSCGSVLGTYVAGNYGRGGAVGNVLQGSANTLEGAVSADGSHVYFTAPGPTIYSEDPACNEPNDVYLRVGGHTVKISESQRTTAVDPDPQPAYFQGAAQNGSVAYFVTNEALTDDASLTADEMLYEFDAETEAIRLVASDGVVGVSAVSPDGSHVYFDRYGKIYVYDRAAQETHLVASTDIQGNSGVGLMTEGFLPSEAKVTSNGRYFLFPATENLTGDRSQHVKQVFLYDDVGRTLSCVSCRRDGVPSSSNASLGSAKGIDFNYNVNFLPIRSLSSDGTRAFFETEEPLVAGDVNDAPDVYEWHLGEIGLVSDGRTPRGSFFFGASSDGRDALISTQESILPSDLDKQDVDLYDARIEGGFPQPVSPEPCQGEGCQGSSGTAPAEQSGATSSFSGPPNKFERKVKPRKKKHKKPRHGKSRRGKPKSTNTKKGR